MPLPPLVKLLDARPTEEAQAMPVVDSVNIPLGELRERLSELPAKLVYLADSAGFLEAKKLLELGGRSVEVVASLYSKETFRKSAGASGRLWSPNEFVVAQTQGLEPGRSLDLGCGIGREACYLVSEGWEVVAVDHLARTLGRAKRFAKLYSDPSRTSFVRGDCFAYDSESDFDLVLSLMCYSSKLPELVQARLRPGGLWLVEAYTKEYQAASGHPSNPERAVSRDELEGLSGFEYHEGWIYHTPYSSILRASLKRK